MAVRRTASVTHHSLRVTVWSTMVPGGGFSRFSSRPRPWKTHATQHEIGWITEQERGSKIYKQYLQTKTDSLGKKYIANLLS